MAMQFIGIWILCICKVTFGVSVLMKMQNLVLMILWYICNGLIIKYLYLFCNFNMRGGVYKKSEYFYGNDLIINYKGISLQKIRL